MSIIHIASQITDVRYVMIDSYLFQVLEEPLAGHVVRLKL